MSTKGTWIDYASGELPNKSGFVMLRFVILPEDRIVQGLASFHDGCFWVKFDNPEQPKRNEIDFTLNVNLNDYPDLYQIHSWKKDNIE